jgi:competence protein ComGF
MLEKIWPDSFTHWKIKSTKRNAVLCKVNYGHTEFGLYWKIQYPNSKIDYLPAVFPRDEKGQIQMPSILESTHWTLNQTEIDCGFEFTFKEREAKTYAELLKQAHRGTPDDDNTIFAEKFEPHPLARLIPIFAIAF